jgi:hypothetical protein
MRNLSLALCLLGFIFTADYIQVHFSSVWILVLAATSFGLLAVYLMFEAAA